MIRENNSALDGLLNAEGNPSSLSASEQRLLKFAVDNFGESLCRILLAGLGWDGGEQQWRFSIIFTDTGDATYECYLQAITYELDGESFLPRRRDPLVLLALLRPILDEAKNTPMELMFKPEDVLTGLDWRDIDEARRVIDDAVERYSALTYIWVLNGGESSQKRRVKGRERLFSNYRTIDEEEGLDGGRQEFRHIVFNTAFINHLRRRTLFGVDWDRVTSIKAIRG